MAAYKPIQKREQNGGLSTALEAQETSDEDRAQTNQPEKPLNTTDSTEAEHQRRQGEEMVNRKWYP